MFSFGLFSGVCSLNADVSEHLNYRHRGNPPKENTRHLKYGESLKSRTTSFVDIVWELSSAEYRRKPCRGHHSFRIVCCAKKYGERTQKRPLRRSNPAHTQPSEMCYAAEAGHSFALLFRLGYLML
jgi:hypothetical protein